MNIQIGPFKAMTPRASARMLPEGNAVLAQGAELTSGELRPFNQSRLVQELDLTGYDVGTIHRWRTGSDSYWLRFPGHVDVVNGPVADSVWERVYWTGDKRYDGPRMSYTGPLQSGSEYPAVSYKLGVPAPSDPIYSLVADSPKSGDIQDIFHERPLRVRTVNPHGLEYGDVVRFDLSNSGSLGDLLNGGEFQIRVEDAYNFTLNNTDGANVQYDSFGTGTFEQYFAPGLLKTRFYVHTFVTEVGEEGPPSEPSEEIALAPVQGATMNLPSMSPNEGEGRRITRRRIYRTATGSSGGQFQFVAELDIAESSYHDTIDTADLGETIPSTTWDPPPKELKGLRVAAQGWLVGFYENKVCFSEPYQPHAWPTNYQLALDSEVIAVEIIDNGVVVGTRGRPYLIQGIEPRSMSPRRLEADHPCVSARSMISLGYAAVYASQDGLVLVSTNGAELITQNVITDREWRPYQPETIHAYEMSGQYVAFYGDGAGGLIFDPRAPDRGIVELGFWVRCGYSEPEESVLYLVNTSDELLAWDDPDEPPEPYRWRSGFFPSMSPVNMSAAKVAATSYDNLTFRLYADGELVREKTVQSRDPFRLPAGYLGREFQLELEGTDHVMRVEVTESASEIEP